jgi:glycosyltransferase involved in cell wall biosynthesis
MKPTVVLPAHNEAEAIGAVLAGIKKAVPDAEILVVDDGSTDDTAEIARRTGAQVVSHPYQIGNGAAVKTGARNASGDIIVFMDADGQHDPADIHRLLEKFEEGYDMVVGARRQTTHASLARRLANAFYNRFASFMPDSGSDVGLPRCAPWQVPALSVPTPERVFLSDNDYHGILPVGTGRYLYPDRGRGPKR